ncbi:hypothetical protein TIFTF001_010805 [Ficus carica]|uniref:Axial regulator YABBY 4 n=1 Tax=Ficus carica TaxID=3494 RepID=A0AA87ZXL5_FICCA|nr:hypothetical protein TIFTF001_010805 [Ficus carica]
MSALNHLLDLSEQICYVQCGFCTTILLVSVPCSSLSMVVTVRCGHCTGLLSVNMMKASFVPSHLLANYLTVQDEQNEEEDLEEVDTQNAIDIGSLVVSSDNEEGEVISEDQIVNKPPEKRQRAPSAYNRFIREEIKRLKAENPNMAHKEAFSTAAKNWAQFPPTEYKGDEESSTQGKENVTLASHVNKVHEEGKVFSEKKGQDQDIYISGKRHEDALGNGPVVQPFAGLPASVACKGVRRGLRHRACAVGGVGRGYFGAECGELVIVRHLQIRTRPREGSWKPRELGCGAMVRGLGRCVGLRCPSWVACVPHVHPGFPPCCYPSFCDDPIAPMVSPVLICVALPEVAVVPLFSLICILCLFVIRAEVSPLVTRVGFCIDLVFVDRVLAVVWLGVVWWVDITFASPIVGVFLRVWDRRLLRLPPSGLIT